MIRKHFNHIPGVGHSVVSVLKKNGVETWDDFLCSYDSLPLSDARKQNMKFYVEESLNAYENHDHSFFSSNVSSSLHWMLYPEFKDQCCFLDIETTGLSKERDIVTVAGIYDSEGSKIFVHGKNMDDFADNISKYSMIVTFNGRCFDVPFLKSSFPGVNFDHLHVDLRFLMKELGYSGGLKKIEKEIGIHREEDVEDVDGFEAVRLWKQYKKGDEEALGKLIRYNIADIENLKVLMDFALEKKSRKNNPPLNE